RPARANIRPGNLRRIEEWRAGKGDRPKTVLYRRCSGPRAGSAGIRRWRATGPITSSACAASVDDTFVPEHDPETAKRFSERIMLRQEAKRGVVDVTWRRSCHQCDELVALADAEPRVDRPEMISDGVFGNAKARRDGLVRQA